jgi:hypothetical protein
MNPGLRELEYEREQKALREAEAEKLRKLTPLEFLCSVWQDPDLPMHVRLRAAAEHAKYSAPQLKAIATVTPRDMASVLDRARARAPRYTNVIKLEIEPAKALPAAQHDPAELKPSPTSAANGGQSSSGFRRRI